MLEARDRVGGRVCSPGGLDVGPSWFWSNEPRINGLISDFGLEAFPQHLAGDALFQTAEGVQRMDGNQIDAPSGRLRGGMAQLTEAMAGVLDAGVVTLGERVRSVKLRSDGVEIGTDRSSWSASSVILALPPATAVASIDFGDSLDREVRDLAAMTPVWMGQMTKVVARFDRPFWRETGLAGSAFSSIGPMRELHDMSGPGGDPAAIFGFAQPRPGQRAPSKDEAIFQLVELFGPAAADVVDVMIQDWRQESLTSPLGGEHLDRYQLFGHSRFQVPALAGRLHWASTETSTVTPGHIEGALAAAERAVATITRSDGLP